MSNRELLNELRDADVFFTFNSWPLHYKQKFLNPHKQRADRFALWHFLFHNGMAPSVATYYVMWHNTYDDSAWRSIRDLESKANTDVNWFWRYKVYDMNEGRIVGGN